jgi:hypothetical protein
MKDRVRLTSKQPWETNFSGGMLRSKRSSRKWTQGGPQYGSSQPSRDRTSFLGLFMHKGFITAPHALFFRHCCVRGERERKGERTGQEISAAHICNHLGLLTRLLLFSEVLSLLTTFSSPSSRGYMTGKPIDMHLSRRTRADERRRR